ncbi:MAG TPA: type II toxin-antitoxin system PemK/MazF family toxin [Tessaracoccus flavescens]|uniref:Type II toxin-antitoxin system PemK/MazF family toxin n=1 Tax=Tessaracoccus flavescens TaxID=399497 RepID=A0A921ERK9_9ACTN|nr:type II toxin-antitoxin system PemK/MazF family toxin [Tessaracoccus flavescens]
MAGKPLVDGIFRVVRDVAVRALNRAVDPKTRKRESQRSQKNSTGYPGDFTDRPRIVYQPIKDGRPDPGEVVWTWVPYEEDYSQGKDRPVLLVGRDGEWLLGLQVTSQDHDRDRDQEARAGRYWIDIGAGAWDNQRRPSEARVNRLIRIDPDAVRRVGAILDEALFDDVAREVLRHY